MFDKVVLIIKNIVGINMWVLLVITFGTMQSSSTIFSHTFETKQACDQAVVHFQQEPWPAFKASAICIGDVKE